MVEHITKGLTFIVNIFQIIHDGEDYPQRSVEWYLG